MSTIGTAIEIIEAYVLVIMAGGFCVWLLCRTLKGSSREAGKISQEQEDPPELDISRLLLAWVEAAPPGVRAFRMGHVIERRFAAGTCEQNLVIDLQIVGPDQSRKREKVTFVAELLKDRERVAKALGILLAHFSKG